jgi:hypothetical protein
MSLLMTGVSLTSPSTTRTCSTMSKEDQSFVNSCSLANTTKSKQSSELVYNFLVEASFLVLFVDAYSAGKHSSIDGFETYLVACCGMTGFASMEPVQHANSKNFASAIMKIQLCYGLCHTIILDKESKFYGVCREALDLLNINRHVLSGEK